MIRVLLVEDDKDYTFIVKNELESFAGEYEVIIASDGKEGLKKWRETEPDIIITDIKMPHLNGLEMIKHIRQTNTDIPIIALTGFAKEQSIEECYNSGANIFIRKTFDINDLNGHIKGFYNSSNFWAYKTKKDFYEIGIYTLNTRSGILHNKITNNTTHVSKTENEILCMLVENINKCVKRTNIVQFMGKKYDFNPGSLYSYISNIRKILNDDPRIIITAVPNVGYILSINN